VARKCKERVSEMKGKKRKKLLVKCSSLRLFNVLLQLLSSSGQQNFIFSTSRSGGFYSPFIVEEAFNVTEKLYKFEWSNVKLIKGLWEREEGLVAAAKLERSPLEIKHER
jgi:hypothetical protein